jgi:hypothetical protein
MIILPAIERRTNGLLPRMALRQKQTAVKLIRSICQNYDNGNCVLKDDGMPVACSQSITCTVNCRHFRWVLLEDKEGLKLKAELFCDETIKRCAVCNSIYQSKSNNAKYCTDCGKVMMKKQKAAYAGRRRSRVEKLK